jgi:hypothetical protein
VNNADVALVADNLAPRHVLREAPEYFGRAGTILGENEIAPSRSQAMAGSGSLARGIVGIVDVERNTRRRPQS